MKTVSNGPLYHINLLPIFLQILFFVLLLPECFRSFSFFLFHFSFSYFHFYNFRVFHQFSMGNLCLNTDKSSSSPINRSEYFLKPISQIFFASIHFSYVSLEMGFPIGKFFHQENEENILFFLSSPIQLHPYVSYEVSTIIYSFHIHPIAQEAYSSIISPELGDFGGACVRRKHFIQRKLIHLGGGCYNLAAD